MAFDTQINENGQLEGPVCKILKEAHHPNGRYRIEAAAGKNGSTSTAVYV